MKIPESGFIEIGIRHLLSPFYLFQYFAVVVWYVEEYWLFATLILIITLSAVYFTTKESYYNLQQLRQLVGSHNKVELINSRYDARKASRAEGNADGEDRDMAGDVERNDGVQGKIPFLLD